MIDPTAIIHPNVKLGKNVKIDAYCIIGYGDFGKTAIGDDAHIRSHSVIYSGTKIGSGFCTGHAVNIRERCHIGNNVSVGTRSVLEHEVYIEDGVRIHSMAFVPEYSKLLKGSWIGPSVVLTNAEYPLSPSTKENLKGVTVCENAKIGANTTVLPGVKIGPNSLVGAASVVTRSIPENKIAFGNPASVKRDMDY